MHRGDIQKETHAQLSKFNSPLLCGWNLGVVSAFGSSVLIQSLVAKPKATRNMESSSTFSYVILRSIALNIKLSPGPSTICFGRNELTALLQGLHGLLSSERGVKKTRIQGTPIDPLQQTAVCMKLDSVDAFFSQSDSLSRTCNKVRIVYPTLSSMKCRDARSFLHWWHRLLMNDSQKIAAKA